MPVFLLLIHLLFLEIDIYAVFGIYCVIFKIFNVCFWWFLGVFF